MQSEKPIIIIAAVLIAVLLIGEVFTYCVHEEYSIEAERTSDGMDWNIHTTGSNTYDILVLDNGTAQTQKTFYFYLDENYGHTSVPGKQPVGSKALTPEEYLSTLEKELNTRGVSDIHYVDAKSLAELISDHSRSKEIALVMVSGSIPDTVYTASDGLAEWIQSGGTLYWAGGIIGEYESHCDGSATQLTNGPQRIIGYDCVNPQHPDGDKNAGLVDKTVAENKLQEALGLTSNCILYSVDAGRLGSSVGHLSLGFTDGTYSSITYVQSGSGQVCVIGGNLTHQQNSDMSQIIASGLCYSSTVIAFEDGTVGSNTGGSISFTATGNVRVYIYLGHGSEYVVYGRGFDL